MIIIDTPPLINAYQLLSLKAALSLEVKGLHLSRGRRASVLVRQILINAGHTVPHSKAELFIAFCVHLRALGILVQQA